jgi:hypothetical protein
MCIVQAQFWSAVVANPPLCSSNRFSMEVPYRTNRKLHIFPRENPTFFAPKVCSATVLTAMADHAWPMVAPLERPPASDVIMAVALAVQKLALLTVTNHRKNSTCTTSNKKSKKLLFFLFMVLFSLFSHPTPLLLFLYFLSILPFVIQSSFPFCLCYQASYIYFSLFFVSVSVFSKQPKKKESICGPAKTLPFRLSKRFDTPSSTHLVLALVNTVLYSTRHLLSGETTGLLNVSGGEVTK